MMMLLVQGKIQTPKVKPRDDQGLPFYTILIFLKAIFKKITGQISEITDLSAKIYLSSQICKITRLLQ